MISNISYWSTFAFIAIILMKNKFNFLFCLNILLNNLTLILMLKRLLIIFYRWLTKFYWLMDFMMWLWNHRVILSSWEYHTFHTFETFIWTSWAFYGKLLIFMTLKMMIILLIRIWLHITNLNIVIIWAYLSKSNFWFVFTMVKSRWMRNIL